MFLKKNKTKELMIEQKLKTNNTETRKTKTQKDEKLVLPKS